MVAFGLCAASGYGRLALLGVVLFAAFTVVSTIFKLAWEILGLLLWLLRAIFHLLRDQMDERTARRERRPWERLRSQKHDASPARVRVEPPRDRIGPVDTEPESPADEDAREPDEVRRTRRR